MKFQRVLALFFIIIIGSSVIAQEDRFGLSVSNNITSFPVTTYHQLLYSQFHPGLDVFYSKKLNRHEKNELNVSANLGAYYHRFIHTDVRIYPAIEYRRLFGQRFSAGFSAGAGYCLALEHLQTFELQDDGTYNQKKLSARSQYLFCAGFGFYYTLFKDRPMGARFSLQLKSFMQGPFVAGYVPLLPVNSLMLGLNIPIENGNHE